MIKEDIVSLISEDLKVVIIYKKMIIGYVMIEFVVKNKDVIDEEIVCVSENMDSLFGVDIIIDWNCYYIYDEILCLILGFVFIVKEGLLKDKVEYYLF